MRGIPFAARLHADRAAALAVLGYGGAPPDDFTAKVLSEAARRVEEAARPRWASERFLVEWLPMGDAGHGAAVNEAVSIGGVALTGRDIAEHLSGCSAAVLFGMTLGAEVDAAIRQAAAADMRMSALMDAAASALCEQYADAADELLRGQASVRGEYLTRRFSPGYGDFSLAVQGGLARLLDLPRAIGVTVGGGGALSPQKSITAVMGAAGVPVAGKLAGCDTCGLREKCDRTRCRIVSRSCLADS